MDKELFIEIGTEEIPSDFLNNIIVNMKEIIKEKLHIFHISFDQVKIFATPRRLIVFISKIADKQDDKVIKKIGPAKKVAFDEFGNLTLAGLSFLKKENIAIKDLKIITNNQREYIGIYKKEIGQKTIDLLCLIIPDFILSIPFKKSMRWSTLKISFVRPIRWIVALLNQDIIPFNIDIIKSGNMSYGHKFMSPESFLVKNFDNYKLQCKQKNVIFDQNERKNLILNEVQKLISSQLKNCKAIIENNILEEIIYLTEFPMALLGNFDKRYLKLPKEVLIKIITNQKNFPIIKNNLITNYFIIIKNTAGNNNLNIKKGNERVIKARLFDANFFYNKDFKIPLTEQVNKLRNRIFYSELGTMYDKVMRLRQLGFFLTKKINPLLIMKVDKAALLCKADLETKMVYEFPDLQGIMGKEYAVIQGENSIVSNAIYEHYLPISANGDLPVTDVGAILSIIDKLDTITGFFCIGKIPSGTTDPYALRRQAIGIINIILNKKWKINLLELIDQNLFLNKFIKSQEIIEIKNNLILFLRKRFQYQVSQLLNVSDDIINAVILNNKIKKFDFCIFFEKIKAIQKFSYSNNFEQLIILFKRIINITKFSVQNFIEPIKQELFLNKEEHILFEEYNKRKSDIFVLIEKNSYEFVLKELTNFIEPLNNFFKVVFILHNNEKIRLNRFAILNNIAALFYQIADFSKLIIKNNNKKEERII